MEKLIKKLFSIFFGQEVRMINLPDEDIDMGIYVIYDKKIRNYTEKELSEFTPDYTITRTSAFSESWLFQIAVHHEAMVRNNEPICDPTSELIDSVTTYKSSELALESLILEVAKKRARSIIKEWDYET